MPDRIADPWEPPAYAGAASARRIGGVLDPWIVDLFAVGWEREDVAPAGSWAFDPQRDENDAEPLGTARENPQAHLASGAPSPVDPWDPEPAPRRRFAPADGATALPRPSVGDAATDLPTFHPNLRRSWFRQDALDAPLHYEAAAKAKSILAIAPPFSSRLRPKLLAAFETLFKVHGDERFFRKMQALAEECGGPEHLHRAVALRGAWEETPEYWLYRAGRDGASRQGEPGRAALTWPLALDVAERRAHLDGEDMIDPAWLDDWRWLRVGDKGFFAFAHYALVRSREHEWANGRSVGILSAEGWEWRESPVSMGSRPGALGIELAFGSPAGTGRQADSLRRLLARRLHRRRLSPPPAEGPRI